MVAEGIKGDRKRDVAHNGDEFFADAGIVDVGLNGSSGATGEFVGVVEDGINGAIGLKELDGGFGADAGHAGDVVAAVTGEGEIVNHAFGGGDLPLGADFFGRVGVVFAGTEDGDMLSGELTEVLIGRGNNDFKPFCRATGGKGAEDIIGFKTFNPNGWDAPRGGEFFGLGNGGKNVFRRLLALRLIGRVTFVAEGGPETFKGNGNVGWRKEANHLFKGGGKQREGGGIDAGGGAARFAEKDKVTTIEDRHQVDDEKFALRSHRKPFIVCAKGRQGREVKEKAVRVAMSQCAW